MPREYFRGEWQEDYAYSPAVAVQGGRHVYLAGVGAIHDEDGNSLAGDFDAQVRHSFRELGETLERAGGKLQDIVTMTVWILEPRYSRRFTQIRKEFFPDGFPASALITVRGFALKEMMVEIQATAVVGD